MNKIFLYITLIFFIHNTNAQLDAGNLMGLPTATDLAELTAIVGPQIGSMAYNLDDDTIYRYTSTGWEAVDGDNIYNTDGTLTGARTVTMGDNPLQLDINYATSTDARAALTLRRSNDNNDEIGIAFRNSGNAYDAIISLSQVNGGIVSDPNIDRGSLNFFTGGNSGTITDVSETLSLLNNNQVKFSQYGTVNTYQFDDNSATRIIGIEADGYVVSVDPTSIGSDDQDATEVNLDNAVDMDGDATNETTVEDAIQDIAPITSKAGRVFYPPSIEIDASAISTNTAAPGDEIIELYNEYTAQFSTPVAQNPGATATIPVYLATELNYYVTYADPAVFANITVDNNGQLRYDIIGTPASSNTLINIVFVVK